MSKKDDKINRLKYIRSLQKFLNSIISTIKKEEFDIIYFRKKVDEHYENINAQTPMRLDNRYLKELKEFVNTTLGFYENHTDDFKVEKQTLLKMANNIRKVTKEQSYQKRKHKKS